MLGLPRADPVGRLAVDREPVGALAAADSLVANNAVDGQANVMLKELMELTDKAVALVPGHFITETTVRRLMKHSHKYVEVAERNLGKERLGMFDFVFARIFCSAYILNHLGVSRRLAKEWREVEAAAYGFISLLWPEVENEEEVFQQMADELLREVV